MVKRILGIVLLLVGASGVVFSVAGFVLLPRAIDETAVALTNSLRQAESSLEQVVSSLLLTRATVRDVNRALETVTANTVLLQRTLDDSQPLLGEVAAVTSEDLPDSIEALQRAIPDMAQVAAAVDDTLTTLSRFRIDRQLLGVRLQFDLGIDYDPSRPFDETVLELGDSLDGLPARLRNLRADLDATRANLAELSAGLAQMGTDLETVNGRLQEITPLLDDYVRIAGDLGDQTRLLRQDMMQQATTLKTVVRLALIWLVFAQLTPLVLGWELLRGGVVK